MSESIQEIPLDIQNTTEIIEDITPSIEDIVTEVPEEPVLEEVSKAKPIKAKTIVIIQNLITIVDSAQPFFSKWWCNGAIWKILFPVNLKLMTWTITDKVSKTKRPPTIANTISCFVIIERVPIPPPSDKEPVSPINTFAGGALNHKKPSADPIIDPQKTDNSPLPSM